MQLMNLKNGDGQYRHLMVTPVVDVKTDGGDRHDIYSQTVQNLNPKP